MRHYLLEVVSLKCQSFRVRVEERVIQFGRTKVEFDVVDTSNVGQVASFGILCIVQEVRLPPAPKLSLLLSL